jgi:putative pyruvate formate lyase activating enzyme
LLLTPNHEVFAVPKTNLNCVVKVQAEHLTMGYYLIAPKHTPAEMQIKLDVNPLSGRQDLKCEEMEDCFLVPVNKMERTPYKGWVFNLEVADHDHSYLAPFVAVSNCQNFDISQAGEGQVIKPERLAKMMLELQARDCHNINFVTPEHVVPQVLEALAFAVEGGLRLPIVYNTSAYDSLTSMRLLDGVVDIYMPDFKLWDAELSFRYLKARDYPDVARRAIKEMHRQVSVLKFDERGFARRGVLLRHLVMPGMLSETREILRFLAEEIASDTYVNMMAQYHPANKVTAEKYPEINRRITTSEYRAAVQIAHAFGLRLDERVR